MSKSVKLNRREFLIASAVSAAGLVVSACAPAPTPVPKPAATAAPKATEPPKAAPTAIPTQAATATPVAAAQAAKEAPQLAELVKAGKLPPLADRLPTKPLTLGCLDAIGDYGGRIRTFTTNLGNAMQEWMYGHSPLRWIDDGLGIAPGMCESYSTNPDNTEWTLNFRKGLKWSDGKPCTVDDVIFWWEDMVIDPDQADVPPDFGQAGGKLAEFIKVDDFTLKIKYAVPAPLTAKRLAMWVNQGVGPRWIAPKHYMQQFHPKYNKDVKNFEVFDQKILFRQNPECPTLTAWMCTKFEPGKSRTWERNPYYYCIDQQGKQLPYIDGIDEIMVADREVQLLTIMQGNVDYMPHTNFYQDLANIATLKENEAKGGYELRLLDSGGGSGIYYFHNFDHPEKKRRDLYRNPKFKAAMAYCMDRKTIQKIIFYNTGELTSGTMSPKAIEFNFNDEARKMYAKWRDSYVEYDIEKAKKLLDEIGVKDVNNDGWREFPDGSKLELRFDYPADTSKANIDGYEICKKGFNAAGLNTVLNPIPPADFGPFWRSGKGEVRMGWGVGDGPDWSIRAGSCPTSRNAGRRCAATTM